MLRKIVCLISAVIILILAVGCGSEPHKPKLGVSFGVGGATRWVKEKQFMEERAKELGADFMIRFNTNDTPKSWREDCFELIDSGIDVLIMIPRDLRQVDDIVDYAKKKNVKVVSYSRAILNPQTDLFIPMTI
jgi:D-xylose transport system substrate-binding protein